MKLRNLIAALMLVVVATAGAFATSNATKLVPVFYIQGGQCLQGTVDVACPFINPTPNCSKLVTPQSGPNLTTQIYADRQDNTCVDPYSTIDPDGK